MPQDWPPDLEADVTQNVMDELEQMTPAHGKDLTNLAASWGVRRKWFETDYMLRKRLVTTVLSNMTTKAYRDGE
jgi:hypothetical protein